MAGPEGLILIVEDNAETRHVLQRVLTMKGYLSIAAEGAVEALDYLRAGTAISVIVLDLHMPNVSGQEFLRELKTDARLAQIPVIVFSAVDLDEPITDVLAHVRKGSDPDELLAAIARVAPAPSSLP